MTNNNSADPDIENPGLEDGGAIGALPQFAPPEPELQAPSLAGESSDGVSAVVDNAAVQPQQQTSGLKGVLLEHGKANFDFKEDESSSYFVKFMDENGEEQIIWGRDLERAIREGDIEIGQRIELINIGQQEVEVRAPVRNEQGQITGFEMKEATRNTWEARVLPDADHSRESGMSATQSTALNAQTPDDQLRAITSAILAAPSDKAQSSASREPTPDEVARVMQHLNIAGAPQALAPRDNDEIVNVTTGQKAQLTGGAALVEGVGSLLGGAMNLAGAAGKAVGQAAKFVANQVSDGAVVQVAKSVAGQDADATHAKAKSAVTPAAINNAETHGGLPSVLPRLSEYRTSQVEKAAANFEQEVDGFWNSSTKLIAFKAEVERIAAERGLSVQDVNEKMKPGGELAELREKFNAMVSENPDSNARKKGMDKALDSYIRQYGRAQEELLNPEQRGIQYDKLKQRLEVSQKEMEKKSSSVPAFASEKGELEPSHFERLQEAVSKIVEKLKEVAKEFMSMIRGKTTENESHAPNP